MDIVYTEDEYRKALRRFLEICVCPNNEKEASELHKLLKAIEDYETRNCECD